jgi:hypothetical protein
MAFLQRITNGEGTVAREYALGRGRVDLLIQWQKQRIVLELKIKHREKTLSDGLEQTANYMEGSQATEGHLLIFTRDPQKSWEEKISRETVSFKSKNIHVWNM